MGANKGSETDDNVDDLCKLLYSNNRFMMWLYSPNEKKVIFIKSLFVMSSIFFLYYWINFFQGSLVLSNGMGLLQDLVFFMAGAIIVIYMFTMVYFFELFTKSFLGSKHSLDTTKNIPSVLDFNKRDGYEKEYEQFIVEQLMFIGGQSSSGKKGLQFTYLLIVSVWLIGFFSWLYLPIENHYGHPTDYPIHYFISTIIGYYIIVHLGHQYLWRLFGILIASRIIFKELKNRDVIAIHPFSDNLVQSFEQYTRLVLILIFSTALPLIGLYLMIISGSGSIKPPDMIAPMVYFLILFLVIFLPLWSVHDAFSSAKQRELKKIQSEFNNLCCCITSDPGCLHQSDAIDTMRRIRYLDSVHSRLENAPTWPFHIKFIPQVISASLSPIMFTALGLML